MRKRIVAGAIVAFIGILVLFTFSRLMFAYVNRPNANAGLQFSFGFVGVSYQFSIIGSLVGMALLGVGAWTANGGRRPIEPETVELRHERPRSDKPVIGN